ncbi:MAG: STAS domain-containing protein [Aureispira sp.]|nr:STAS domain-containing protein [Aureispira sp.]
MKYSVEKNEEYAVLTLEEENLNSVKAPDLKSELILLKNGGIKNMIINLENVKFVDSSGLSAILTGNRLWTEDGKQFMIVGVKHPSVKMLISISRLDSVLSIKDSLSEAAKLIMMETLKSEIQGDNSDSEEDE